MQVTLWEMVRRAAWAAARGTGRSFMAMGALWMAPFGREDAPRAPSSPPAGHPERLCPEVPLSEVELALNRQLADVGRVER
ncbi:hypothetical protein GTY65_17665 [Streptomyces sp. SID8379]|uniref:DUF6059 family protein n=1 Tax=unclassified Streptomyces TaxID=2593676 RepID=UPI00035C257C|nr:MULTISPECIES: DUF6059 family protein [unclassified Streptomyces]MYW65869.1 hypothetical protein [Streptomyces sp. SID8379]